jgi:hypothetical protein
VGVAPKARFGAAGMACRRVQRPEMAQRGDAERHGRHALRLQPRQDRTDGPRCGLRRGVEDVVKLRLAAERRDGLEVLRRNGAGVAALVEAELVDGLPEIPADRLRASASRSTIAARSDIDDPGALQEILDLGAPGRIVVDGGGLAVFDPSKSFLSEDRLAGRPRSR